MTREFTLSDHESTSREYPTLREIKDEMALITLGQKHTEPVIEMDGEEVKRYEIEVHQENGWKTIYNYQKANYDHTNPDLPSTAKYGGSIHVVVLDPEGNADYRLSGLVANYKNGRWVYPEKKSEG